MWLLSRDLPLTDLGVSCVWVLMELVRETVLGGEGQAVDVFYTLYTYSCVSMLLLK